MSVAVVMGSDSDLPVMGAAAEVLERFEVPHVVHCVSAHRDPHAMLAFADRAAADGVQVIVAGAGGAAHLPGMIASATELPVIGVPVGRPAMGGLDALLSIAQMPAGIPVATMAIDGAENAALLAARILALTDTATAAAMRRHQAALVNAVTARNDRVQAQVADPDRSPSGA